MYCNHCGKELIHTVKCCPFCGAKIGTDAPSENEEATVGVWDTTETTFGNTSAENTSHAQKKVKNRTNPEPEFTAKDDTIPNYTSNSSSSASSKSNGHKKKKHTGRTILIIAASVIVLAIIGTITDNDKKINDDVTGSIVADSGEASKQEPVKEEAFEPGIVNGGSYKNDYFGIGCNLDDNWVFLDNDDYVIYTDEQTYQNALDEGKFVTEMVAQNSINGEQIFITIEKAIGLTGMVVDEADYAEAVITHTKDANSDAFDQYELNRVNFLGETHTGCIFFKTVNGVTLHQQMIVLHKGNYFARIELLSDSTNGIENLIDNFYSLNG